MKDQESPKKKKRGRPRKDDLVKAKNPVGRPKGDNSVIEEYKQRMLTSPKSRKVLDSIFNAALDDDHKHQSAAWKLLMDRLVPLSYFEKDKLGGGRSSISISISGVGETSVVGETLEGDFEHNDT